MTRLGHVDMEERLRMVEGRTRRLAGAGLLSFGALAIVWAGCGGAARDAVQAPEFGLVDPGGHVYAALKIGESGPGLYIYDDEGNTRASLVHNEEETALYIRDDADQIRIGVAQFAHGGGGVALHGPEAKGAAVLYLKGQGSLTFYDTEGNMILRTPNAD